MLSKKVRLLNTERDGYFWKVHNDDMRPLFSKGISDAGIKGQRKLIEEVGTGFEAVPVPCNSITYEPVPLLAPRPPPTEEDQKRSRQSGSLYDTGISESTSSYNDIEVKRLKMELQNSNSQCEFALYQLQECTSQLQMAVQTKEYYESFIVKIFNSMDEIGRMIDGIREESYRAFGSHWTTDTTQASPSDLVPSYINNKH